MNSIMQLSKEDNCPIELVAIKLFCARVHLICKQNSDVPFCQFSQMYSTSYVVSALAAGGP